MSDKLTISGLTADARSKAIDLINKYKYNRQQQNNAVAANWTPAQQNALMNALNNTTNDAACGRTK